MKRRHPLRRNGHGAAVRAARGQTHKGWETWEAICALFGHRCVYCRKQFSSVFGLTRDHIWPLSRGGGGLAQKNIVPACDPCNQEKGDRSAYEYWLWLRAEGRPADFLLPANLWRRPDEKPSLVHLAGRG